MSRLARPDGVVDHRRRATSAPLRLALPSKGMEDDTVAFLQGCGLSIARTNPRQYRARMSGLPGGPVDIVFQRAADIVDEVNQGTVDLGITGYDLVAEHRAEDDAIVVVHPALGFQRASLVLAVPEGWLDVSSVADLAEVAAELRASGRELRVASKFINLTRQFFYARGITYFELVEISGALEAAPSLDTADVICDLTSSGVTLRENRLKTIGGGTVVESQACLIGNRAALAASAERLDAVRHLLELIDASLRARQHVSLTANVRGESEADVARRVAQAAGADLAIGGLRGPTVARVYPKEPIAEDGGAWFAATVVIAEQVLLAAVDALRRAGAGEISATPVRYVFEHRSWTFERLRRQLDGREDVAEEGLPAAPSLARTTAWPSS